jgi:hypothetical protein
MVEQGTEQRPILFTLTPQQAQATISAHPLVRAFGSWPDVRLTDGRTPEDGRLQVRLSGRWHDVCSDARNWTQIDAQIVCRQLGMRGGRFDRWFKATGFESKATDIGSPDGPSSVRLDRPNCSGAERFVFDCSGWPSRQLGSGSCDRLPVLGLQCDSQLIDGNAFWTGLRFVHTPHELQLSNEAIDDKSTRHVSRSSLSHVTIEMAGEDSDGRIVAGLNVLGVPPRMRQVTVKWSAGSGLNLTHPPDAIRLSHVNSIENRGYGVFVNSSFGSVQLQHMQVQRNGADGVRVALQDLVQPGHDFCQFAKSGPTQMYPVRLTHERMEAGRSYATRCCQSFELPKKLDDARLTIHFTHLHSESAARDTHERLSEKDAYIEVLDGYERKRLGRFAVRSTARPGSFTSSRHLLHVCYTPAEQRRVQFTLLATAGHGRVYDLNVTRSQVSDNNGRGIWLQYARSGLALNHSIVANNSGFAGVHVQRGAGHVVVNNSAIRDHSTGDGLHVFAAHGERHVHRTLITGNRGHGVVYEFDERAVESWRPISEWSAADQLFDYSIAKSDLSSNRRNGIWIGAACSSAFRLNVSMNSISQHSQSAFHFHSCPSWNSSADHELLFTHNKVFENDRPAVLIVPALHLSNLLLAHNEFAFNRRGAVYIDNEQAALNQPLISRATARVHVYSNVFSHNQGPFVASIGLVENSDMQSALVERNIFRDNSVREANAALNARARVAAVVAISSSNVGVLRNNLVNPDSRYELGSHLQQHARVITASHNFFGAVSTRRQTSGVLRRVFDRKNRYDLALIRCFPFRTDEHEWDSEETLWPETNQRDQRLPFVRTSGGRNIGGEVRGQLQLPSGVYRVTDDILIAPGSVLTLRERTVLEFDHAIGLMVQGELDLRGSLNQPIVFRGSGMSGSAAPLSSADSNKE